jgi:hypothetical protein
MSAIKHSAVRACFGSEFAQLGVRSQRRYEPVAVAYLDVRLSDLAFEPAHKMTAKPITHTGGQSREATSLIGSDFKKKKCQ